MDSVLRTRDLLALSIDGGVKRTWESLGVQTQNICLTSSLLLSAMVELELPELIPKDGVKWA